MEKKVGKKKENKRIKQYKSFIKLLLLYSITTMMMTVFTAIVCKSLWQLF